MAAQTTMADIVIKNGDAAGEGFNDPSPYSAVDGNAASTLGQARLNAFRHAAQLVDATISSPVTIPVSAQMNPMGGSANSATLGSAGPTQVFRDFSGAPITGTWYVAALANALHGSDLLVGVDDIQAQFNSDVDGDVVLGTRHWYYGFGQPAGQSFEFMTTVRHEIVHGLGFLALVNSAGQRYGNFNDAYILNLEQHGAITPDFPSMTDTQRAAAMIDTGNLHWVGSNVRAASGILTDGSGRTGDHVLLFAPNPYRSGSSTSHFDTSLVPNELMEPYLTNNPASVLTSALLQDIGWTISGTAILPEADLLTTAQITGAINPGTSPTSLQITASNTAPTIVPHPTLELVIPANVSITNTQASTGSCIQLANLLRCDLESLTASANGTVTLDATVSDGSETTLAFNLSSPLFDTDMGNNKTQVVINPPVIVPDISITNAQAQEGNTGDSATLTFTVTLSSATSVDVSVDYATTESSATSGIDYEDVSGTLVITAGSTTGSIAVPLLPDDDIEDDETLSITLSNASGSTITQANAIGTILSDDALTLSVADIDTNEGNAGESPILSFTVSLSGAYSADVSVNYATADGTATAGSDYQAASGTLVIPAGQTSATIPVTISGDDTYEINETLTLLLSNPSNPATIDQAAAIGTLINDDTLTLSIADASTNEGDSGENPSLTFTVTLSGAYSADVSVNYATVDGTATATSDYQAASGTLIIPAGQTSVAIPVTVIGDDAIEDNETLSLVLSNPSSPATLDRATAIGTLINDDTAAVPPPTSISIDNAQTEEGNSGETRTLQFNVLLSSATSIDVSIDYASSGNTATPGIDYINASGTLVIPAGNTSVIIPVTIIGDDVSEPDETLTMTISNPSTPATLNQATATGTLINDDNAPAPAPAPSGNGGGGSGGMGLFLISLLPFLLRRRMTTL